MGGFGKKSGGYHYSLRVDSHRKDLAGREKEVENAVKSALKGRKASIHVHPSHFHVFLKMEGREKVGFASDLRDRLSGLGVRWDSKDYMIPVSSLSREYVSRLLEDLHREPRI